MAADFYFAAKSVGLSKVCGRKPSTLLAAARHNLREIQAEQGACARIDETRCAENVILAGPQDAAGVEALGLQAAGGVDLKKLRRDRVQAIELVFSLAPDTGIDVLGYFRRCLSWTVQAMGLPVLSAVAHFDEAVPHCHMLLAPFAGGRYVGGKPLGKPELKKLRESFWRAVAGPAGLRRMNAKLYGQSRRVGIDAALGQLERQRDPVLTSPLWPMLRQAIERDPLAALAVLGIDPQGLRLGGTQAGKPDPVNTPKPAEPKPIGIEVLHANPIGIENDPEKTQSLSCVGIALQTIPSERLNLAHQAQQRAIAKHKPRRLNSPVSAPTTLADEVGVTRIRDADFDVEEWRHAAYVA